MGVIFGERMADPAERLLAPAMWSVVVNAAATVQAVATKAAGATGVRHVLYGVVATIATGATAQTPLVFQVLDGSTPIFSAVVAAPADGVGKIAISGLHISGTAATAMVAQFGGAGVTSSIQNVTLIGYDVDD